MPSHDAKRHVSVYLLPSHVEFLTQERKRLQKELGIKVTLNELLQCLVEQHRLRWIAMATHDADSVPWMYRHMREHVDPNLRRAVPEHSASTTGTAEGGARKGDLRYLLDDSAFEDD